MLAVGRNQAALDELKKTTGCAVFRGDLTQVGVCKEVVASAVKELGGLTTLVNNAGCLKGGAFGSDACTLENFMFNFNGNTKTTFEMMEHAIPVLKQCGPHGGASIVNVSSVNGQMSFAGVPAYCISKAAVDMMTRCASLDLAPFGIRVNSVNPGVVITNFQKAGGMSDDAYDQVNIHS